MKKWFILHSEGIQIAVQAVPKSAKNAIGSIIVDAEGREVLKLRITAVPDKGKANDAIIVLLAKTWKLPVSSIAIVSGDTSRKKRLLIKGDGKILLKIMEQWDKSIPR